MRTLPPASYDEWLSLPEAEQERIKEHVWNAYDRDRIDVPYMALARLIASTERTVLEGSIGTYHGGEYLLHVYVPESEISECPSPLKQRFEGFRVYWMCSPAVTEGECWEFEIKNVALNVIGMRLTLNARRHKYRTTVDVFNASGEPLVVSRVTSHDKGFAFNLVDLHPDVDDTHIMIPTASNGWRHEYTVRRDV